MITHLFRSAFVFMFMLPGVLRCEVIPKDMGLVHYLNIYFEEDFKPGAASYQLNVYRDSSALVKDSAFIHLHAPYPAFRAQGFDWGRKYFWRVKSFNKKGKLMTADPMHVFMTVPKVSSDFFSDIELRVRTNKTDKHLGGYVVIDYLRGIYTREGNPVWLLPPLKGYVNNGSQIRDLEFTADNTLTFLSDNNPLEIDLEGNILWSLPNPFVFKNDTIVFHHDFKKTSQGTYFMLGNKSVYRRILVNYTEELKKLNRDVVYIKNEPYTRTDVPVLLELEKDGKVLWFWDSSDYLKDEDLNYRKTPIGFPLVYPHANAMSVNDENTKVYLGFRDLSRIIKIDKQTKQVELSYGEKYPSGEAIFANNLFRQQHDAKVTNHNSILLLNNNGARKTASASSILELKDNAQAGDSVLLWRFDLNFDTLTDGRSNSGGNVTEMPNSNILLCAGQLNRLFEVTRNKEIVWDAFVFSLGKKDSLWQAMPNYRGSWVQNLHLDHILLDLLSVKKQRKNKFRVELKLVNVNDREDTFHLEFLSDQGQVLYRSKTPAIPINESLTTTYEFALGTQAVKAVTIKLSSQHYPYVNKIVTLTIK